MPKPKFPVKRAKVDTSDSDSGPDDVTPVKKSKASGSSSSAQSRGNPSVEGQEPTWELGRNKKVKVREFKGRTFIDIREYYIDKSTMDTRPGKKGISLSCEQYQILKAAIPDIDRALP